MRTVLSSSTLLVGLSLSAAILSSATARLAAADSPQWIWNDAQATVKAGQDPVIFRRTFELAATPESAALSITCDNRYEAVVNGVLIGQGEDWQQPQRFILKGLLRAGDNRIAIRAKNDDDGPGGLAVQLTVGGDPAGATSIVSDANWRVRQDDSTNDVWWAGDEQADWSAAIALGDLKSLAPWAGKVLWDEPQEILIQRNLRPQQEKFEFLDGDAVTLIGGTWVERQQAFNYLETLVASAYPDRNITFRNLGWSGDDVFGIARAVFGTQEDGFQRLRDDLLRTAPNVIIVNYGSNEAFAGEAGLETFERGWNRLTRLLESTGATLVFVSPHYLENLGPPLPDPTDMNHKIDRYTEALRGWCQDRNYHFVDFRRAIDTERVRDDFVPDIRDRLTDNGLHFNDYGYWRSDRHLAEKLNVPLPQWSVAISMGDTSREVKGGTLTEFEQGPARLQFTIKDKQLPYPVAPDTAPRGGKMVGSQSEFVFLGLPEGTYGLNIAGQPTVMATHDQWAKGVLLDRGKALAQVEQLRAAIGKKNELYFHRYRPQNETYLFLFRKHEQGNNAVEVPQFEGLVADQEKQIRELRQPRPVTYELIRIQQPNP